MKFFFKVTKKIGDQEIQFCYISKSSNFRKINLQPSNFQRLFYLNEQYMGQFANNLDILRMPILKFLQKQYIKGNTIIVVSICYVSVTIILPTQIKLLGTLETFDKQFIAFKLK